MSIIKYFKKMKLKREEMIKLQEQEYKEYMIRSQERKVENKLVDDIMRSVSDILFENDKMSIFSLKAGEYYKVPWYFPNPLRLEKIAETDKYYKQFWQSNSYTLSQYNSKNVDEKIDKNGEIYKEFPTGYYSYRIVDAKGEELAFVSSIEYLPYEDFPMSRDIYKLLRDKFKKTLKESHYLQEYKKDHELWESFVDSLKLTDAKKAIDYNNKVKSITLNSPLKKPLILEMASTSYEDANYNVYLGTTKRREHVGGKNNAERYNKYNDPYLFLLDYQTLDYAVKSEKLIDKKDIIEELKSIENINEILEANKNTSADKYYKQAAEKTNEVEQAN